MRISDWSSDVCSSDLIHSCPAPARFARYAGNRQRNRHRYSSNGGTRVHVHQAHGARACRPHEVSEERPRPHPRRRPIVATGIAPRGNTARSKAGCADAHAWEGTTSLRPEPVPHLCRSEERRGGKECGSTCRYRGSPYHKKKKKKK